MRILVGLVEVDIFGFRFVILVLSVMCFPKHQVEVVEGNIYLDMFP
jgi:hypothetical protein